MYYEQLQQLGRFWCMNKQAALSQPAQDFIKKYSIKRIIRALKPENTSLLKDKAHTAKNAVIDSAMSHAGFLPEQIKGLRDAKGGMIMAYEPIDGVIAFTGHRSNPAYSQLMQETFGKKYINDADKAIETVKSYGMKPPSLIADYRNPSGGVKSIRRIREGDDDIHEGMILAGGDQVGGGLIPRFVVTRAKGIPGSSASLGERGVYGKGARNQIDYDYSAGVHMPTSEANDKLLVYKSGDGLDSMFRHAATKPIQIGGYPLFSNMNVAPDIKAAGSYMHDAAADDLVKVLPMGSPKHGKYHLFGDDFTIATSGRGRPKIIGSPTRAEREYAYLSNNVNTNNRLVEQMRQAFDANNIDDKNFLNQISSIYSK